MAIVLGRLKIVGGIRMSWLSVRSWQETPLFEGRNQLPMADQMDPDDLYDVLREEGVMEISEGDRLVFSEEFTRIRDRFRDEVIGFNRDTFVSSVSPFIDEQHDLSVADFDESLLADSLAVQEACSTLEPIACTHVALAIERIETARKEPVPEGFLSLSASEIDSFISQHPASVLYFWRNDCEPCDAVREDFESVLQDHEIPPQVGFGAVYGPDHVQTIREEYDVGGAPTILFCSYGAVESRFVGNPGVKALENEMLLLFENLDE